MSQREGWVPCESKQPSATCAARSAVRPRSMLVYLVGVLTWAGCGGGGTPDVSTQVAPRLPQEAHGAVKIGVLLPLSGSLATLARDTKDGIELAAAEANAAGATGPRITMVYRDSASEPNGAATAAGRLVDEDHVSIMIGDIASSLTTSAAGVAQDRATVLLTPGSTAPGVTAIGPFIFGVPVADDDQAKAIATYMTRDRKLVKVGVLYDPSAPDSALLATAFRDEVGRRGAQLVLDVTVDTRSKDFGTVLSRVRDSGAESVFVPLYFNSVVEMASQAKAAGMSGSTFMGSDGWADPSLPAKAGDALEGAVYLDHWAVDVPTAESQSFVEAYRRQTGREPLALSAVGFEAARLAISVVRRSSGGGESIRQAMLGTTDFVSLVGPARFDDRRRLTKRMVALSIRNGRAQFLALVDPR